VEHPVIEMVIFCKQYEKYAIFWMCAIEKDQKYHPSCSWKSNSMWHNLYFYFAAIAVGLL